MKKLDIRSVLIGVLATALVFVLIGATSPNKNLGDIMCNSIAVVDENGNPVVVLDAGEDGGILGIGNTDGNLVALLSADKDGGAFDIYNTHNNQVGYFGSTTDQDGMIILSDRYGDIGWSVDGKQN